MADETFMHRCLQLAGLGAGYVAPNPMVGALLVHEGNIIGEGYHRLYGEAHAEVNALRQAFQNGHAALVSRSSLYVSLEPCSHFGKTPPCADLIIENRIPKVIIACRDPFKEVNHLLNTTVGQEKGIEKLVAAGIEVEVGMLDKESRELNKRFFTYHIHHRPFIILKWAETSDGFIATSPSPPSVSASGGLPKAMPAFLHKRRGETSEDSAMKRLLISNEYTNRLVHKWRSEEAGILAGTNTALQDDPELTARLWPGPSPIRLVVDMDLRLPLSLKIFNRNVRTVIFNTIKHEENGDLFYYQVTHDANLVPQVLNALYQLKIQSILVEGGARLIQSFIDEGIWDEARIIKSSALRVESGLVAPQLQQAFKTEEQAILSDTVEIFKSVRG